MGKENFDAHDKDRYADFCLEICISGRKKKLVLCALKCMPWFGVTTSFRCLVTLFGIDS